MNVDPRNKHERNASKEKKKESVEFKRWNATKREWKEKEIEDRIRVEIIKEKGGRG